MRTSIFIKIFVSLICVSLSILSLVTVVVLFNFRGGLQQFINYQEQDSLTPLVNVLTKHYQEKSGWQFLRQHPEQWSSMLRDIGVADSHLTKTQAPTEEPTEDIKPPPNTQSNYPPPKPPPGKQLQHHLGMPQIGQAPPAVNAPIAPQQTPNTKHVLQTKHDDSKHHLTQETPPLLPLSERLGLLDKEKDQVIQLKHHSSNQFTKQVVPIYNNKTVIGYLQIEQPKKLDSSLSVAFVKRQVQATLLTALAALIVAITFSYLLVKHFLKPLGELKRGTMSLVAGNLEHRIDIRTHDEFGTLTRDFNKLASTLQKQKISRDLWLSDISHELRTPLAVLRGEIEALQDGIRKPEPRYIDSLHSQVINLSKLVEDLHLLSLSEIDEQRDFELDLDLDEVVREAISRHALRFSEKSLTLNYSTSETTKIRLRACRKDLNQILDNLLQNCYRYTSRGGEVKLTLSKQHKNISLVIADTKPGVPDEAIEYLFERLYRVDSSRTRTGEGAAGSGLGLAICKHLVLANGGNISASHSAEGGLKMTINFPIVGHDE